MTSFMLNPYAAKIHPRVKTIAVILRDLSDGFRFTRPGPVHKPIHRGMCIWVGLNPTHSAVDGRMTAQCDILMREESPVRSPLKPPVTHKSDLALVLAQCSSAYRPLQKGTDHTRLREAMGGHFRLES